MTRKFFTDTELLQGLAEGKRDAVAALYTQYHSILIKWIIARGGSEADAEDVFQEALVVLYEKSRLAEFCLTCKLSTYLLAICTRLWYKKNQKNAFFTQLIEEGESEEDTFTEDIEAHEEKELQYERLEEALNQLGEPCSALLKAFYIKKQNMQQIAAEFQYTNAENAKTQKYKCLNRLRKIFLSTEMKVKS